MTPVDLEALEKFYAHHGWIHDEPWKELLSEVRALRAERDALNESADALSDRWDGLVAERDALKLDVLNYSEKAGEVDYWRERVAQLTRLGNAMADALHGEQKEPKAVLAAIAWRRAAPGGKFPTQHQPKEHTMPTIEELQSKITELESLISKLMAERNAPPGAMPPFPAEKTAEQKIQEAYLNGCKDQCEKDAKMFDEFVPGNAKHIRDNLITEPPQP